MNRFTDAGQMWDDDYEILIPDAKPCPFCGCRYIRTKTAGFYETVGVTVLIIDCMECGCSMAYFSSDEDQGQQPYETAYAGALTKWNRRTGV